MPPKKGKTINSNKVTRTRKPRATRQPARTRAITFGNHLVEYTAETGQSRLRTGRIRVLRVNFISDVSTLTPSILRRLRAQIEEDVQEFNETHRGILNADIVFNGRVHTASLQAGREGRQDGEGMISGSDRDANTASLAYLLREANNDYFIATPPVTHGVRRRVHLLLGRYDRRVYVRKLVYSDQKPTEATLWPRTMSQSLRPGQTLNVSAAPGVPRLISCVNLGKDPNDNTSEDQKVAIWSIISEWLPGVTLERLTRYLASTPSLSRQATAVRRQNHTSMVQQIGADLITAVQLLEAEGKVHQDLTPANVLISQSHSSMPSVTLIDFSTMRQLNTPNNSTIPNDDTITKVKDGFGVSLCMADMLAVTFPGSGSGRANMVLASRPEAQWLQDFQTQAQSFSEPGQWDQWIADFQAQVTTPADGQMHRIMPPSGNKFAQEEPPIEPLAFAKRHKVTRAHRNIEPLTPFTIGPHRKVWIEPFAWEILAQEGNLGW